MNVVMTNATLVMTEPPMVCTLCGKKFTKEEWAKLEARGHVGHWRAHGTLYAIEMRQCPDPCNGTMGVEVSNPTMKDTEEVSESA